jgi:hypothetical protein
MRYWAEENIENDPQTPFMIVTRSASRKFLYYDQPTVYERAYNARLTREK